MENPEVIVKQRISSGGLPMDIFYLKLSWADEGGTQAVVYGKDLVEPVRDAIEKVRLKRKHILHNKKMREKKN